MLKMILVRNKYIFKSKIFSVISKLLLCHKKCMTLHEQELYLKNEIMYLNEKM